MAKASTILVPAIRLICEFERATNHLLHFVGYRRRYYSQKGQDRWLVERVFCKRTAGYFVDVGAGDGCTHSNTYVLETDYGWTGILIEANPAYVAALSENRRSVVVLSCVDSEARDVSFLCFGHMGGIVADDTDYASQKRDGFLRRHADKITCMRAQALVDILDASGAPRRIQYLNIDVEGAEARILAEFPFDRNTFEAITVERPTLAVHRCLSEAGYVLVKIRWCEGFYLYHDVATRLGAASRPFDGMPSKSF
jgi:FkbM family methyltransferase